MARSDRRTVVGGTPRAPPSRMLQLCALVRANLHCSWTASDIGTARGGRSAAPPRCPPGQLVKRLDDQVASNPSAASSGDTGVDRDDAPAAAITAGELVAHPARDTVADPHRWVGELAVRERQQEQRRHGLAIFDDPVRLEQRQQRRACGVLVIERGAGLAAVGKHDRAAQPGADGCLDAQVGKSPSSGSPSIPHERSIR